MRNQQRRNRRRTGVVGATVLLACGWMAVLAGTASAAPGVPSVSHTVACVVGGGHVEVTVANDGEPGDDPLEVEIHDRDPDIIAWEGQVLPGASHTEGFDGVEDGVSTYLVVVDGESTQVIVPVDCSDPSLGSVSIDCGAGTATLQLANGGTNPSVITVLADGEPVDTVTVGPGGSAQVVVPLAASRTTTVVVVGDGEQVATSASSPSTAVRPPPRPRRARCSAPVRRGTRPARSRPPASCPTRARTPCRPACSGPPWSSVVACSPWLLDVGGPDPLARPSPVPRGRPGSIRLVSTGSSGPGPGATGASRVTRMLCEQGVTPCQPPSWSAPSGVTRARASSPTSSPRRCTWWCATRAATTPATPSWSTARPSPCSWSPAASSTTTSPRSSATAWWSTRGCSRRDRRAASQGRRHVAGCGSAATPT